jgi:hypothetical protein
MTVSAINVMQSDIGDAGRTPARLSHAVIRPVDLQVMMGWTMRDSCSKPEHESELSAAPHLDPYVRGLLQGRRLFVQAAGNLGPFGEIIANVAAPQSRDARVDAERRHSRGFARCCYSHDMERWGSDRLLH